VAELMVLYSCKIFFFSLINPFPAEKKATKESERLTRTKLLTEKLIDAEPLALSSHHNSFVNFPNHLRITPPVSKSNKRPPSATVTGDNEEVLSDSVPVSELEEE
jgi:hypothetical protein